MVPEPVVRKRLTFNLSSQVRVQVERRVEGDKLATPTPTTSISDNNGIITKVVEALLSPMYGDVILFFLEMTFLVPGVRTGRRGALPKQKVRIIEKNRAKISGHNSWTRTTSTFASWFPPRSDRPSWWTDARCSNQKWGRGSPQARHRQSSQSPMTGYMKQTLPR